MKKQLEKIKSIADKELTQVKSINELEELRIKFLGKKGQLTKVLRGMGQLTIEERPVIGKLANKVRSEIEKNIQEQKEKLETQIKNLRLSKEEIDITLPGKKISIGNKPVSYTHLDVYKRQQLSLL